MTLARRGSGSGKFTAEGTGNPIAVTGLPSSLAGSLIVCSWSFNGASVNITSATSNVGGTWGIFQSALSAGNNRAGFAYCLSSPSGVTQVSLTGSAGSPAMVASIDEFTYSGTCTKDQQNSATGSSNPTPLSSGNITNTVATALLFGVFGSDDSSAGTVTQGGSGTWTQTHNEGDTSLHHAGCAGFQNVTTVGPHNYTGTYNVETAVAAAAIISFFDSGASSSQAQLPRPPGAMLLPGSGSNVMRAFFTRPPTPITAGANFSDSVAESVAFTDAQTAQVDFSVARAESLAFTDAQAASAIFTVQRDESIAFTDAQTGGISLATVQRDESIAFTDSQTGVATFAGQRDESVAFTDAQTVQVDFSVARAESVAFTDAQAATAIFAVQRDEAIAFTDSQDASIAVGGASQVDETIAFSDSQSAQTDFVAAVNESINFTDAQTAEVPGEVQDLFGNYARVGFGPFVRQVFASRAALHHWSTARPSILPAPQLPPQPEPAIITTPAPHASRPPQAHSITRTPTFIEAGLTLTRSDGTVSAPVLTLTRSKPKENT